MLIAIDYDVGIKLRDAVTICTDVSDWDHIVRDWQNRGGNQIRAGYQQALSARRPA